VETAIGSSRVALRSNVCRCVGAWLFANAWCMNAATTAVCSLSPLSGALRTDSATDPSPNPILSFKFSSGEVPGEQSVSQTRAVFGINWRNDASLVKLSRPILVSCLQRHSRPLLSQPEQSKQRHRAARGELDTHKVIGAQVQKSCAVLVNVEMGASHIIGNGVTAWLAVRSCRWLLYSFTLYYLQTVLRPPKRGAPQL
jgi:hypothetical protein